MTTVEGQWLAVDDGWGRKAADFASLSEPANCREYVAVHRLVELRPGDRLLDVACGAGLALELATIRGAHIAGIDASPRLVAVARDRLPGADLRVGDMMALPWSDASFDAVTSCRGIWGTTAPAVAEARRVLRPGGRLCITVWGHLKAAEGSWALAPFRLAAPEKVANQSSMVSLGRPGVGEDLLSQHGFVAVERHEIPFAWEFADPATYARALASTGPAYEAIQAVGEEVFLRYAEDLARDRVRQGLPLRAEIPVVAFTARAPRRPAEAPPVDAASYLRPAEPTTVGERLAADDLEELGFVMNATRLWQHDAEANESLFALLDHLARRCGLDATDRGVLVSATASSMGDPYCSAAWGQRLASTTSAAAAASVLTGRDDVLSPRHQALAAWARTVSADPRTTTARDVQSLRDAGFEDAQILDITFYVGLRRAFSTVNNALGARVDDALIAGLEPDVASVVVPMLARS